MISTPNSTAVRTPGVTSTTLVQLLGSTYGAALLGTFFSLILYGLILHQAYRYIRLHPHDYAYIQVLVVVSLILETLHTICTMHVSYHSLVTNYFKPLALLKNFWSIGLFILSGELSRITTYSFFVRRIYFVAGNFKYVAVLAATLLATEVGFSVAIIIQLFRTTNIVNFVTVTLEQESYLIHGRFAAAAAAHVVTTVSLIYALCQGKKIRKRRNVVLDLLMLYVVNTGLLVGVFDIFSWILASVFPGTAWWIASLMVTVKLYMVTFLSVLNSRRLPANGGIEIFGTDSTIERNFIARAQLLATAERYNAPSSRSAGRRGLTSMSRPRSRATATFARRTAPWTSKRGRWWGCSWADSSGLLDRAAVNATSAS